MKTITIVIGNAGQIAIQTHGFEGANCKDATRTLEQGLGIVLSDKPNFDQGASHSVVESLQ